VWVAGIPWTQESWSMRSSCASFLALPFPWHWRVAQNNCSLHWKWWSSCISSSSSSTASSTATATLILIHQNSECTVWCWEGVLVVWHARNSNNHLEVTCHNSTFV
jgi:hypothetical protein